MSYDFTATGSQPTEWTLGMTYTDPEAFERIFGPTAISHSLRMTGLKPTQPPCPKCGDRVDGWTLNDITGTPGEDPFTYEVTGTSVTYSPCGHEVAVVEELARVTDQDLRHRVCECGHRALNHRAVPHHHGPMRTECECRKTEEQVQLVHWNAVARREVVRELRSMAESFDHYADEEERHEYDAHAFIRRASATNLRERADEIEREEQGA